MIFISAGHYPARPGARFERFIEHDEAVIWADQLHGAITDSMLVPTGVLKDKVSFINERVSNGDIALEIHFNAAKNAEGKNVGRGCETLYYPESGKGKTLARVCQNALVQFYPPDRGVKEGWYRMNPANGPDFFLSKTKCPAVILEPDFVHRFELIQTHRDDAIHALAQALKEKYCAEVENISSGIELDTVSDS